MAKTIKLCNLDPEAADILVQLSGDMLKFNGQRYRLSRMDATRLQMFIEDLNRRYSLGDKFPNKPNITITAKP